MKVGRRCSCWVRRGWPHHRSCFCAFTEAIVVLESLGAEFPVETCKLLVECSDVDPTLAELATTLVSDLLCEDDENVELWYLMGVAALACSPPDVETAEQYLQTALEVCATSFQPSGKFEVFDICSESKSRRCSPGYSKTAKAKARSSHSASNFSWSTNICTSQSKSERHFPQLRKANTTITMTATKKVKRCPRTHNFSNHAASSLRRVVFSI